MPKFRKKPVIVQAIQWTGENLREVIDLAGLHPSANKWSWPEYEQVVRDHGLKIFTREGPLMASVGHWIVRGDNGDVWPVADDYFRASYEPATGGEERE